MAEELKVGDVPVLHLSRDSGLEELVRDEVEAADSWVTVDAVAAGVDCDNASGEKLEERDAVPVLEGLEPPLQVENDVVVERNWSVESRGTILGVEKEVEVDPARVDDPGTEEELPSDALDFFLGGRGLGGEGLDGGDVGGELVGGQGHGVVDEVELDAESDAHIGRRNQVARGGRRLKTQLFDDGEERREEEGSIVLDGHNDEIVNVGMAKIVATRTLLGAATVETRIGDTGRRGNLSPEDPGNGIAPSLRTETGSSVAKAEAPIQKQLVSPSDGEEGSLAGADEEEPIVS